MDHKGVEVGAEQHGVQRLKVELEPAYTHILSPCYCYFQIISTQLPCAGTPSVASPVVPCEVAAPVFYLNTLPSADGCRCTVLRRSAPSLFSAVPCVDVHQALNIASSSCMHDTHVVAWP
jgi:hypothetical protein